MSLRTSQPTVDTSGASQIVPLRIDRKNLVLSNASGVTVYIGAQGVTSTNGFPLLTGSTLVLQNFIDALYGVVASGSQTVGVFENA